MSWFNQDPLKVLHRYPYPPSFLPFPLKCLRQFTSPLSTLATQFLGTQSSTGGSCSRRRASQLSVLIPLSPSVCVCLVAQSCPTLCDPKDSSPPDFSVHGDSPGKNTGMVSHALFQGIFLTQELNQGLPHFRQILYHLSHHGSPRILDWVAYPLSRGSSQPRNWTRVSCIAGDSLLAELPGKPSLPLTWHYSCLLPA